MHFRALTLALIGLLSLATAETSPSDDTKMDYVEPCARGCIRDAAQKNLGNKCPSIQPEDFECIMDQSCPVKFWKCPCENRKTMATGEAKDCVIKACNITGAMKVKAQMEGVCEKAEEA